MTAVSSRTRAVVIGRRSLAAVLVIWGLGAAAPARAAPCDERKLAHLDGELAAIASSHLTLVLGGLHEACALPASIDEAFRKVLMSGEEDNAEAAGLSVVAADLALWKRACTGGPQVIVDAGRRLGDPSWGPRERAQALWKGCGVDRLGVATADEWKRAGKGAVLAIATAQWLRETAKLAPARTRAYTRAIAGLDEPVVRTLAEQYPDDGLAGGDAVPPPPPPPPPPPRRGLRSPPPTRAHDRQIGPPLVPGSLDVQLASYLGRSDIAAQLAAAAQADRARLEACFQAFSGELPITLAVVIADGVAQRGELLSVREVDGVKHVSGAAVEPQLERCLLSRIGRVRFPSFSAPTRLELSLSTGTSPDGIARRPAPPADDDPGGVPGGVAGGVVGGVAGGADQPPGSGAVSGQIFQKRSSLDERASRRFDDQVQQTRELADCASRFSGRTLDTAVTIAVRGRAITEVRFDPAPDAETVRCLTAAWKQFKPRAAVTGTLVYTFRFTRD